MMQTSCNLFIFCFIIAAPITGSSLWPEQKSGGQGNCSQKLNNGSLQILPRTHTAIQSTFFSNPYKNIKSQKKQKQRKDKTKFVFTVNVVHCIRAEMFKTSGSKVLLFLNRRNIFSSIQTSQHSKGGFAATRRLSLDINKQTLGNIPD